MKRRRLQVADEEDDGGRERHARVKRIYHSHSILTFLAQLFADSSVNLFELAMMQIEHLRI